MRNFGHFLTHVFTDQSAYICAIVSSFSRKPTRSGFVLGFDSSSLILIRRLFATVAAKATLRHGEAGKPAFGVSDAYQVWNWKGDPCSLHGKVTLVVYASTMI